ncbi:hypothetical protein, partial [Hoylesella marshii]|uniref:hypothetical protein n=1 Tax=Hoylesella marshii TaxID=189722 RepID=UPI0028D9002F
ALSRTRSFIIQYCSYGFLSSSIRLSISCLPPSFDVARYAFDRTTNLLNDHQNKICTGSND